MILLSRTAYAGSAEFCAAKWPTDYQMQGYCINRNGEAAKKLLALMAGSREGSEEANIVARCGGKWGEDMTMVLYCTEQQLAAYRALSATRPTPRPPVGEQSTIRTDDASSPELDAMRGQNGLR